jgi:hypothetical protein
MYYTFEFTFEADDLEDAEDITDDMIRVYCKGYMKEDGTCECKHGNWIGLLIAAEDIID